MAKHRLKLRELRRILSSYDVSEDPSSGKGSHSSFDLHHFQYERRTTK